MIHLYHQIIAIIIMTLGVYIAMSSKNLIKKLMGLNIFQVSALLLYISLSYIKNGKAPILDLYNKKKDIIYNNPLPHVLMLTAIVVGICTIVVGLTIINCIYSITKSIEEDEINDLDNT